MKSEPVREDVNGALRFTAYSYVFYMRGDIHMTVNRLDVGLGGGSLLQIANRAGAQMMSYLIDTPEGQVVMIDGGHPVEEDARYLYELLLERGGKVDLWLITHAHSDHYGALCWMLENITPFDIEIADLRFSFPPAEWLDSVDSDGPLQTIFTRLLERNALRPKALQAGDTFTVGGMRLDVLWDGSHYRRYHCVNDTSCVIRAHYPKRDVLFLADLGREAGADLLAEIGAEKLRCDIVQMAHHGQDGVDRRFYEAVRPKVCLYCAPDWLWDCDSGSGKGSGPWKTLETRRWMEELGAQVSCPHAFGDYLLV